MLKHTVSKMALIAVFITGGATVELLADDKPEELGRGDTKKLIRKAEEHMANYAHAQWQEQKKGKDRSDVPNRVVHADSPLVGKICKLKLKFKSHKKGGTFKSVLQGQPPDQQQVDTSDTYVLVASMNQKLHKVYEYNKWFNTYRGLRKNFEKEVKELRHEVRFKMLTGYQPAEETPKRFRAEALITAVEWDHSLVLPVMVVYAELIESDELKIDAD